MERFPRLFQHLLSHAHTTALDKEEPIRLLEAVFLCEASLRTWCGRGDNILLQCFETLLTNTVKLGLRSPRSYR